MALAIVLLGAASLLLVPGPASSSPPPTDQAQPAASPRLLFADLPSTLTALEIPGLPLADDPAVVAALRRARLPVTPDDGGAGQGGGALEAAAAAIAAVERSAAAAMLAPPPAASPASAPEPSTSPPAAPGPAPVPVAPPVADGTTAPPPVPAFPAATTTQPARLPDVTVATTTTTTVATTTTTTTSAPAAARTTRSSGVEADVVSLTNQDRARSGLGLLSRNGCLDSAASEFAHQMATSGVLAHNPGAAGAVRGCRPNAAWGDNVGTSTPCSPTLLEERWMASPSHRRNILTADFQHVGVGAWTDAQGSCWVQVLFSS